MKSLHHEDRDIKADVQGLIREYSKSKIELVCGDNLNELSGKDKDRIWFSAYQGLILRIGRMNKVRDILDIVIKHNDTTCDGLISELMILLKTL